MSDAPLTDRFMFGKPGIWSDWKDKDHLSLENHARRLEKALKVAEEALGKVNRWHNEFPSTGRTWENGQPMSYSAAFGSNGERDFMRDVCLNALSTIAKLKEEK